MFLSEFRGTKPPKVHLKINVKFIFDVKFYTIRKARLDKWGVNLTDPFEKYFLYSEFLLN